MKLLKLRLVVDVTYKVAKSETVESLKERLGIAADRMADQGLLSGDGPSTVKTWNAEVEEVVPSPPNKAVKKPTKKDIQACKELAFKHDLSPLKAVAQYVRANKHLTVTEEFITRLRYAMYPNYREH